MNCNILSLEKLCLRAVVQNFEKLHFSFTVSNDKSMQQNLNFLKRRFSVQLATALHMEFKLKDEYLVFFVNKYLNFFAGKWVKNRPHLESMENLFCRLPNLTRICFRHCNDEILENIATCCPKIVEIDVRHSEITDDGIKHLYEAKNGLLPCPDLKHLFIDRTRVTDSGVECLIRNIPSLEKIEYRNIPLLLYSIYENNFPENVQHYDLVELKLSWFEKIYKYSDVLKTCLNVCPKLESLSCEIHQTEELSLITDNHLKKLHITFINEDSKINLDNFLKRIGFNLTVLKISSWNLDCSCSLSVDSLSTHCPRLKEFYAQNVIFKDDKDEDVEITFSFLTKCCFSLIDPSAAKGLCLLLSSSPKLESISMRFMYKSPPEVKNEILKWCVKPSVKLIEFAFLDLEMEFITKILLKSPCLKMMFLFQCILDVRNPYDFLSSFIKNHNIEPRIYFKKFTCSSDICELRYMRRIDNESLVGFNFPSYDYYLREEYRRPSTYDSLFLETAFDEFYSDEDEDWEDNWKTI